MEQDVLITFLPNEVIEVILENENLSFVDVVNFARTCKHLHRTVFFSNKLWRIKFFQRWPLLKEAYENYEKHETKIKTWLGEIQTSIATRKELMRRLSEMSAKNYRKQELSHSELKDFDPLFRPDEGSHPLSYHFCVDELTDLIKKPDLNSNLTDKYYAHKVARYMRQHCLTEEWQKFTNLPPKEQILERGAVLVAQWSQPEKHVNYSCVSSQLDEIAERTKSVLKEQHPTHPLFSLPAEQFRLWRTKNIDDNQWSGTRTRQVIAALREIMFNRLGFQGDSEVYCTSEMYYSSENSFIDQVLERKHGIPITIAIIFESVARRVGVRCEPVSSPAHFFLRWKEKYVIPETEDVEVFYIDVFTGQFLTKNNCPRIGRLSMYPIECYNSLNAATAVEVVQRMANNLEVAARQCRYLNGRASRLRSALELMHMVRPYDNATILDLARFYMLHQMDLAKLVDVLNRIQEGSELSSRGPACSILRMLQDYENHMNVVREEIVDVKRRKPEVKYAVGMIMKHRRYEYTCVITGWDARCEASLEWMNEMGVEELSGGSHQPFYNVFADDGSSRYVAQENLLILATPQWINNFEIGRYFCEFNGTHYTPNAEKAAEYPEDAEVRNSLITT